MPVELTYRFHDPGLRTRALSHRSVGAANNERFEFLGDGLLNMLVAEMLFEQFPKADEGELTRRRSHLVSEPALAAVARELELGDQLLLGPGELKSGGHRRDSILADALEALIAAVYLDSGFEEAAGMVNRLLAQRIETVEFKGFYDFKTRLQETSQARMRATPTYEVVQELGPDHDKRFVVAVKIGSDEWARAVGKSKKEAEQMAAAEAHFRLEGSDVGIRPKR